jgi:glycine cleavage system regulatory protein
MSKSLVITLIGDDRPGIVESISSVIVQHQGEWVESRMANLSGKFAGILRVNLPDDQCESFIEKLKSSVGGLNLTIEQVEVNQQRNQQQCYRLELVGQDRPGIIHRISSLLVNNGATVEELESEVIDASMSGEKLFKANITLCLAEGYSMDELSKVLEDLANELIVDIELG